ncbi:MAG: hypothetical protein ABFD04_09360 [Syntrophomonas sp.]
MAEDNVLEMFGLPKTVMGSDEWLGLEKLEFSIGPEALLEQLIEKKLLSNAEIVWMLRRLIYFYGKKDPLLKKAPVERLFTTMCNTLRTFLLIMDLEDPQLDDNMRTYISAKLTDSTWGINQRTRVYLEKL